MDLPQKVPPQNTEAEQSILGAVLLDKNAILKVADILTSDDFYRDDHRIIFESMLTLFEKRSPIDLVTLTNELETDKKLKEVGGAGYLSSLVNGVPSSAHITRYAEIVRHKATLRRLIHASAKIIELGFNESDDIVDVLDQAETTIMGVSQKFSSDNFVPIKAVLEESFNRIDQLHKNKGSVRGVPTGFRDLDNLLSGMQASDLIIIAARPSMGKTALVLNIAQNVALKSKIPVGFFSLEQSREQIVDRLLCMEAGVDLYKLRTGQLHEDDFPKIGYAMGSLAEAPIFIDDSPMLSVMEIRAKARRLQMEHGLGLVIIDYLQLMEGKSGSGEQNRVQEVSQISRALKGLGRELNVPVIALSQLSRAVESRDKKIPMLSDLRESGCLAGDTLILNAQNGQRFPIKDLVGRDDFYCLSADDEMKLKKSLASRIFSTGKKQVYELVLTSGKKIKATSNHKFKLLDDWKPLGDLKVGDYIATPRVINNFKNKNDELTDGKIVVLAHLIGDGCYLKKQPLHYTNADEECLKIVDRCAKEEFGTINRWVKQGNWHHLYLSSPEKLARGRRNPIVKWLDEELGIFDQRSGEKRIPQAIFGLSNEKIALFLRHLFATDGGLTKSSLVWRLHYTTKSRLLVEDVCHLLLRFGILSRIKVNKKTGYDNVFDLVINGDDQKKFLQKIGIYGAKTQNVAKALDEICDIKRNTNVDIIPSEIWLRIKNIYNKIGWTGRKFHEEMGWAYSGTQRYKNGISRFRLAEIAKVLKNDELMRFAQSDIFWDQIKEINTLGVEEVFDITVPGEHNFIANDLVVHNSIEQDADVVMFIYRDDYYNKETENKNIAEILVRKHRNGPTGDVKLYFQPSQTKFGNLDHARANKPGVGAE